MKIIPWLLPLLLLAVGSGAGVTHITHADTTMSLNQNKRNQMAATEAGPPPDLNWIMDRWTGSDKPFMTVKGAVDNVAQQGRLSRPVLETYRSQARNHPRDPVAQFRLGYACYVAWNGGISLGTEADYLDPLLDVARGLQQAPPPHSYEYTRLLFIISAMRSPSHLSPIGRRLLQHTPEDYDVEFYFYESLLSAATPAEREQALTGAQKLIKQYPERRGGPYAALAEVYTVQWKRGDVQSGPLAVAAYRKYLSMPPKGLTPQSREGLEHWMDFIRTHPKGPKGPKIG